MIQLLNKGDKMEQFTLIKLWNLREELDNSITNRDYEKIKLVKVKYQKLVDSVSHSNSAFTCYNFPFKTINDKQVHISQNVISLLRNIEDYEKKYIYGKNVSVKLKTPYLNGFLSEEICIFTSGDFLDG